MATVAMTSIMTTLQEKGLKLTKMRSLYDRFNSTVVNVANTTDSYSYDNSYDNVFTYNLTIINIAIINDVATSNGPRSTYMFQGIKQDSLRYQNNLTRNQHRFTNINHNLSERKR
ncbi:hypothetical protein VNO78_18533 [Psophocarpus tetragonolobus]|uniref:Uncharacterized protein n=1 Tax=Psophocarpus tetragonolobus TaxID=3891 RepID=A0AAN9XM42_PSOTE